MTLAWVSQTLGIEPSIPAKSANFETLASAKNSALGSVIFVRDKALAQGPNLGACAALICDAKIAEIISADVPLFVTDNPQFAFLKLATSLFPGSLGDSSLGNEEEFVRQTNGALISPTALLEGDVNVGPGAIVGDGVEIGSGSRIGPNAVIAQNCKIGRNTHIGANCTIQYALIGDRVLIHPNVAIGQDGFGYMPGPKGITKMPQLGRVIIQDDVDLGAGTCVDRGTLDDTVIGQGSKLDNLVQVAHNVTIGMHTVVAAQAGFSGSATIGDLCRIGGSVGIADQVTLGNRVEIAATSGVMNDVPDGETWGGTPAQPLRSFFRELATLRRLAKAPKTPRGDA